MQEEDLSQIKGSSISLVIKTELRSRLWRRCYFLLRHLMKGQIFVGNVIFKLSLLYNGSGRLFKDPSHSRKSHFHWNFDRNQPVHLLYFVSPWGSLPRQAAGSQEHWLLEKGSSHASCPLKQVHRVGHLGTNCKFLFLLQQIVQKSSSFFFNPLSVLPQSSAIRLHCPSVLLLWILGYSALPCISILFLPVYAKKNN